MGIVRSLEAKLIVDRREHEALVFPAGTPLTWGHLYAGRYSIEGYERRVAVEHITLSSLARAVSRDRSRLWARLERMCWLDAAALVVSASMPEMMLHGYSSRVMPPCVLGSCNAIMIDFGIPVVWAGNRGCAAQMVASFLRLAARRMDESREEVEDGECKQRAARSGYGSDNTGSPMHGGDVPRGRYLRASDGSDGADQACYTALQVNARARSEAEAPATGDVDAADCGDAQGAGHGGSALAVIHVQDGRGIRS